jgi:Domain of unknown function (DUF4136)
MRLSRLSLSCAMLVLSAAVLISGCAATPEIHRDTNPKATFATYKTYGFFSPLSTDKAGYESTFTMHLKAATRRVMESKGYVYSDSSPNLLVNFYANVQDKQEVRATTNSSAPGGYGSYRYGYYGYRNGYYGGFDTTTVQTTNYKHGTVTVDVIDAKQKVLAWTATAEGRVSSEARNNPGPAIDTLISNMLEPLPNAGT